MDVNLGDEATFNWFVFSKGGLYGSWGIGIDASRKFEILSC